MHVDGVPIVPLAHIRPGSVVRERSFFDGEPRSANVWAVTKGELLRLEPQVYECFAQEEPALACDLVFAFGRVLSSRLRRTGYPVRR